MYKMNRNALTKKQIKKMSVDEYIEYLLKISPSLSAGMEEFE